MSDTIANYAGSTIEMSFSTVPEAVEQIRTGGVVIVVDDENRENEGDFICAAEKATADSVNLIMSGRGDFCMPILPETAERLELKPLVERNTANLQTAFLTPLDHVSARTGITAEERAHCVRAIADPNSRPDDFQRPGHVHLLMAKEGGVLRRAGHTEAAVDLARMAGLAPAGVLCEVLDDSGDRATRDQLFEISKQKGLPIITIEDLIAYRRTSEKLVTRIANAKLPTKYGNSRLSATMSNSRSNNRSPSSWAIPINNHWLRWCGCTAAVSRAIYWLRSAVIAVTNWISL